MDAIGEIIGGAAEALTGILEAMSRVTLYEDHITTTKIKRYNGKISSITKHERPVKITMLHALMLYVALRMAGLIDPWDSNGNNKQPWWAGAFGLLGQEYPYGAFGAAGIAYEELSKLGINLGSLGGPAGVGMGALSQLTAAQVAEQANAALAATGHYTQPGEEEGGQGMTWTNVGEPIDPDASRGGTRPRGRRGSTV